jgi:hypothetical protein
MNAEGREQPSLVQSLLTAFELGPYPHGLQMRYSDKLNPC